MHFAGDSSLIIHHSSFFPPHSSLPCLLQAELLEDAQRGGIGFAGLNFNVFLHLNNSLLYKQIAARLQPQDQLVMFFDYRPALVYYTQRDAIAFQMKNELAYGMTNEPARRGYVETFEQLRAIASGCRGKLYGFVDPDDVQKRLGPIRDALVPADFPKTPDTVVFEVKFPKETPGP